MRQFLDQLPRVIAPRPTRCGGTTTRGSSSSSRARSRRRCTCVRRTSPTIRSRATARKRYLVHPYRLAYAQGGLYLLAYVPEYGEVRTFAVERIQEMSLLEERFTPIEELPDAAFPHSLGVHSGPPERVEIEFQPAVADYVARACGISLRT